MRIALIADTHLSARSPECIANWHAARRAVSRLAPDITVNLGDVTLDGQSHPEELDLALGLVRQWPTPIHCVPGNHDVGDGSGELAFDASLLTAYVNRFGPDHWALRAGDWLLIGVNAQLMGSDTAQEHAQWQWIESQATLAGPLANTVLFSHRPVWRPTASEATRKGRYVSQAVRDRLLHGPLRPSLRMVISGHTHQYLDLSDDGVRHVWVPSSAFVLPDHMQSRIGEKVVGLGLLTLEFGTAAFDLWCTDGMVRHSVSDLRVFQELAARRDAAGTH